MNTSEYKEQIEESVRLAQAELALAGSRLQGVTLALDSATDPTLRLELHHRRRVLEDSRSELTALVAELETLLREVVHWRDRDIQNPTMAARLKPLLEAERRALQEMEGAVLASLKREALPRLEAALESHERAVEALREQAFSIGGWRATPGSLLALALVNALKKLGRTMSPSGQEERTMT